MRKVPAIAKVRLSELEEFLRHNGDCWSIEASQAFMEHVIGEPMSTDELVAAIGGYVVATSSPSGGEEKVFVLSDASTPELMVSFLEEMGTPEVDATQLDGYIPRSGRGEDFLWVSCTAEDLSNASYIVILPGKTL